MRKNSYQMLTQHSSDRLQAVDRSKWSESATKLAHLRTVVHDSNPTNHEEDLL